MPSSTYFIGVWGPKPLNPKPNVVMITWTPRVAVMGECIELVFVRLGERVCVCIYIYIYAYIGRPVGNSNRNSTSDNS